MTGLAITELTRSVAFLVDNERFSTNRAYIALAVSDDEGYGSAEFLFINERGEPMWVPTEHCIAVEPERLSLTWPNAYRGRRRRVDPDDKDTDG